MDQFKQALKDVCLVDGFYAPTTWEAVEETLRKREYSTEVNSTDLATLIFHARQVGLLEEGLI
jgi:hypothetical protein